VNKAIVFGMAVILLGPLAAAREPKMGAPESECDAPADDRTIEQLDEAIQLNPKDASAYRDRAKLYLALGEYDKAIADFGDSVRLNPRDASAYRIRGGLYLKLDQFDKAIADFTHAIHNERDNAKVYCLRGWSHLRKGQSNQAFRGGGEPLRLNREPDYVRDSTERANLVQLSFQLAIEDFGEAIRIEPQDASYHVIRGELYQEIGNHREAAADFTQAIRIKPDAADAYRGRGFSYKMLGRRRKAIEDFSEIIRLAPEQASGFINRAECHAFFSDPDRAIEDLTAALCLEPDDIAARLQRGAQYAEKGDLDQAIDDYTEVIRLEPENAFAYSRRGFWQAKKGNHDKAIEDFTQVIGLDPDDSTALIGRAGSYKAKGLRDKANEDLAAAYRLDFNGGTGADAQTSRDSAPAVADRWDEVEKIAVTAPAQNANNVPNGRGDLLPEFLRTGSAWKSEPIKAADSHDLILPPKSRDPAAIMRQAVANAGMGNHLKAIDGYTEVIADEPNNARAYVCRGKSFEALGKWYRALKDYAQAVKLNQPHESELARNNLERLNRALRKKWSFVEASVLSMELDPALEKITGGTRPSVSSQSDVPGISEKSDELPGAFALCELWIADEEYKEKVLAKWSEIESGLRELIAQSACRSLRTLRERNCSQSLVDRRTEFGRVFWAEYRRSGTARVRIGSEEIEVLFEFVEKTALETVETPRAMSEAEIFRIPHLDESLSP